MFVTTWLGILQLSTGRLVAANAGHEYPVCRRAGGDFALVKDRHGFVQDGKVTLRFEDDGKPFDPLAAAEPDTTPFGGGNGTSAGWALPGQTHDGRDAL